MVYIYIYICDPLRKNQPYGKKNSPVFFSRGFAVLIFVGPIAANLTPIRHVRTHRATPVFMSNGQTTRFRETAIFSCV